MDYFRQRELFDAIKNDDVKRYLDLADETVGSVRWGRFPVLSVCYLFGAKKISALCEEEYIGKNAWEELPELPELSPKFASVAGKALRLYRAEVLSPLEALLVLGETNKAKRLFAYAHPSGAQKARMQSLYAIKYGSEVRFDKDKMIVKSPPMSGAKKKKILWSALSVALVVAILVSTPFVVNVFHPFIGVETQYSEPEIDPVVPDIPVNPTPSDVVTEVRSIDEIDFSSDKSYRLIDDLVLPEKFGVEEHNCTLDGQGHTITISGDKTLFSTLRGTIKDVSFVASGTWEKDEDFAFLVGKNNGVIENVSLTVSGKMTVVAKDSGGETFLAGVALENTAVSETTGYITSCRVAYALEIAGDVAASASFAGVVTENNRVVRDCVVEGKISSVDCDLAGVCMQNAYLLYRDKNTASITQTTDAQGWSPLCAGVVLKNASGYYSTAAVRECENEGNIGVESDFDSEKEFDENTKFSVAESGGVVVANESGAVVDCKNSGKVSAKSVECVTYAGGVCALSSRGSATFSSPSISGCENAGEVQSECKKITALSAGVVALASGTLVSGSVNVAGAKISLFVADCTYGDSYSAVGGVCANGNNSSFSSCQSEGEIRAEGKVPYHYAGGLTAISSACDGCVCSVKMTVATESKEIFIGGMVGRANGSVSNAIASCDVTAEGAEVVNAGGLVGYTAMSVSSSRAEGNLSVGGTVVYAGGLVGCLGVEISGWYYYPGAVTGSVFDGAVTAIGVEKTYLGGVVGYAGERIFGEDSSGYAGTTVKNNFSVGTLTVGEGGNVGCVVGGTTKRLADEDVEKKYFGDNAYLSGAYAAFGVYLTEEGTEPGDDRGSIPYATREEIEALDGYIEGAESDVPEA
ncbi:MAG: hypothetical protein IJ735_08010 [Clostridia bacterium]|nr:hypothetical protein [Clostridia bacterium]